MDGGESRPDLPGWMTEEVQTWVQEAVNCIDVETDKLRLSGSNISKFEILTEEILRKMNLSPEDYLLTEKTLEGRTRSLYNSAKTEPDPVTAFAEQWTAFMRELASEEPEPHVIGFPLNLRRQTSNIPRDLDILDIQFTQLPRPEWRATFVTPARNNENFQRYEEKDALNPVASPAWTFWFTSIEARDHEYAINRVEEAIELLLGAINFANYYWTQWGLRTWSRAEPRRWSRLREPFMYLAFKGGEYSHLYYTDDITRRRPLRLSSGSDEFLNDILENVQELDPDDEVDAAAIGALRCYQHAMEATTFEDAFIAFWQGLETATLCRPDKPTENVVQRGASFLQFAHDQKLQQRMLKRLAAKRNALVHQRVGETITKSELNLIKTLLDSKLLNLINLRGDYPASDIRFLFQHGGRTEKELEAAIRQKQQTATQKTRDAELLQEILNGREDSDEDRNETTEK